MRMNQVSRPIARVFRRRIVGAAVLCGLPLIVGTGCLLTSGQILISIDLANPITVPTVTSAIRQNIDLNDIGDYADHKDKLNDLTDLALLGKVTNTGSNAVSIEFWLTPASSNHTTAAAVRADPTGILLWGPLALAGGETQQIDWDASAGLFAGRQALLTEAQGDGQFTLYALPSTSSPTASFQVENGVLVLVLDAGI